MVVKKGDDHHFEIHAFKYNSTLISCCVIFELEYQADEQRHQSDANQVLETFSSENARAESIPELEVWQMKSKQVWATAPVNPSQPLLDESRNES